MRLVVVLALCVLACSSAEDAPTVDAAQPSCATTSCVTGASCALPNGAGSCRCLEPGQWTCGTSATSPNDGGFAVDASTPQPDTTLTAPPADRAEPTFYFPFREGGCSEYAAACDGAISPAYAKLTAMMLECGLACTRLSLYTDPGGCPQVVSLDAEWTDGALACVADAIGSYRWPCARSFEARTTSCPK